MTATTKTKMATKAEKTQEIVVTSIRSNRSSIRAEWNQGDDDYAVTFHDNPLPSFYKALEALAVHVCSLSEFAAKDSEKIEPTGITVSQKGESVLALITAKKKLKRNKRVLNVATPLLAMYQNEEDKGADHMTEEEAGAVEKVIKEAKKYISGERAQGKLAFEETKPKPDKKTDNTTAFPGMEDPTP